MSIKVLIADDHPLVLDGLRYCIEHNSKDIDIVAEASDGLSVLETEGRMPIDVFVLDINMPRLNGLETLRRLIVKRPKTKAIILSIYDTQAMVEEAIDTGAFGYITKETVSKTIIDAIYAVFSGNYYFSPDITHLLIRKTPKRVKVRKLQNGIEALTNQEKKILQRIVEGHSSKDIAAEFGLSVNTISTHRKHLMAKLDIHKQTDLVRFAIRKGYTKA
jgi:two-component system, NarL family, response regulator DegU